MNNERFCLCEIPVPVMGRRQFTCETCNRAIPPNDALPIVMYGFHKRLSRLFGLLERMEPLIEEQPSGPAPVEPGLYTIAQAAIRLGVKEKWLYEHQADYGAIKLGPGPKAQVRLSAARVEAEVERADNGDPPEPPTPLAPRRRSRASSPVDLLQIKGRKAA